MTALRETLTALQAGMTPGPWVTGEYYESPDIPISALDSGHGTYKTIKSGERILEPRQEIVAVAKWLPHLPSGGTCSYPQKPNEETKANARLIAVADLLPRMALALDRYYLADDRSEAHPIVTEVRAILAELAKRLGATP